MHGTAHKLAFVTLVGLMVSLAYALNFAYFSDNELAPFGDRIRFWHSDTLTGPVRSNYQIAIMQDPVFYDYVIQAGAWNDFEHGDGYNPHFYGPEPVFHAPPFNFPGGTASTIRQRAFDEGNFFNAGPDMQAWVQIRHDTLRMRWAEMGEPFDTLNYEDVLLGDSANVFFDATLRLSGTVSTVLILGASGRIGLEDNLVYASSIPPWGIPVPGHPEKLALISENEIKVLNTFANGRENSSGLGNLQTDPDLTSIALDGIFVVLNGSFTFDQQNDPDSGYVFCSGGQPGPDDRGRIYIAGNLMQHQRNYVHRSNCASTGYLKNYHYDNDLRHWNFGLFDSTYRENLVEPATLNFGTVMLGDTAWDTVRVYNDFVPPWLTGIQTGTINFATRFDSSGYKWVHRIPVGFAPQAAETLSDVLTFNIPYYNRSVSVPLSGIGSTLSSSDPPFIAHRSSLIAYPNPFNATTTLSFSLPQAGKVELKVYDVTGREAQTLINTVMTAGQQQVVFDAADLPSGVYFARLEAATQITTHKLLLLK